MTVRRIGALALARAFFTGNFMDLFYEWVVQGLLNAMLSKFSSAFLKIINSHKP